MEYEAVIGLETHVQLKTNSKMFSYRRKSNIDEKNLKDEKHYQYTSDKNHSYQPN